MSLHFMCLYFMCLYLMCLYFTEMQAPMSRLNSEESASICSSMQIPSNASSYRNAVDSVSSNFSNINLQTNAGGSLQHQQHLHSTYPEKMYSPYLQQSQQPPSNFLPSQHTKSLTQTPLTSSSNSNAVRLQEKKLEEFQHSQYASPASSLNATGFPSTTTSIMQPSSSESKDDPYVSHPADPKKLDYISSFDSDSTQSQPSSVLSGPTSSAASGIHISSTSSEALAGMPEALRLQHMYDLKKSGSCGEQIQQKSLTSLKCAEVGISALQRSESIASNPDDYFPPADPEKLARMMAFDGNNSSFTQEDRFVDHPTDPRKMEYLQNLDSQALTEGQKALPTVGSVSEASSHLELHHMSHASMSNTPNGNQFSHFAPSDCHTVENYTTRDRKDSDVDNNAPGVGNVEYEHTVTMEDTKKPLGNKTNSFFSNYKQQREILYQESELDEDDTTMCSLESRFQT